MSALAGWYRELRDAGSSESEAVAVVAQRLDESVPEARRLLTDVARVRLGGGRGGAQPVASRVDARAVREVYRARREEGARESDAVRATAREFSSRPHDVRRIVGPVEYELGRE